VPEGLTTARVIGNAGALRAPAAGGLLKQWDADVRRAARARSSGLSTDADVDDLAQEARLRLVLVARRRADMPVPYLRTVVANAVRAASRRYRQRAKVEELSEELAAPCEEPRDRRAGEVVARWVEQLPSSLQAVYQALYRDDRAQRETATMLGISQPRVAQLHRALLERGRRELKHLAA
jgi:RNA polymerase sigma factor (sigma-70 family)